MKEIKFKPLLKDINCARCNKRCLVDKDNEFAKIFKRANLKVELKEFL